MLDNNKAEKNNNKMLLFLFIILIFVGLVFFWLVIGDKVLKNNQSPSQDSLNLNQKNTLEAQRNNSNNPKSKNNEVDSELGNSANEEEVPLLDVKETTELLVEENKVEVEIETSNVVNSSETIGETSLEEDIEFMDGTPPKE